jgi:hypothetical protein
VELNLFVAFLFVVFIKFYIVCESGEFYFIHCWSCVSFGKLVFLAR